MMRSSINASETWEIDRDGLHAALGLVRLPEKPTVSLRAGPKRPASLRMAHAGLERELARTLELGGLEGIVAGNAAKALRVHFREEEDALLPLMSFMSSLRGGTALPEPEDVQMMTCLLEAAMPGLLEDHRVIKESLGDIAGACRGNEGGRLARFAEMFSIHAGTEEEILYPAALLIGETLEGELQAHHSLRRYYRRL
jgi:hypothetical protein